MDGITARPVRPAIDEHRTLSNMNDLEKLDAVRAMRWLDGSLELLDQRALPQQEIWLRLNSVRDVADAIRDMVVRGAPAIGVTAAYGCVLAAAERHAAAPGGWRQGIEADLDTLGAARPTAVNLHWAIRRMRDVIQQCDGDPVPALLREAEAIHREDIEANRRMGELGAPFLQGSEVVLTHCNTGSLATGGFGTALGVIRSAWSRGFIQSIYAAETRPWLQGSRLTAWELQQDGIPATIITDSAAAHLMAAGGVGWVVVGADRITAAGDVANKIGTYSHAIAARYHGLGFMVVAPTSTIDRDITDAAAIPIEERNAAELLSLAGNATAPLGSAAYNPVFDITPAGLVDVLVTEKGVVENPDLASVAALFEA